MLELTPFPSIFPVETEENIIDQLSDCVPALRNCALTCRAWLPRSRFHLLHSVRIKSEKQLETFSDMLNKYPTRRLWIALVTMVPTAKGSNPRRLLEAFPSVLLANTPNLERWEVNQAGARTVAQRSTLFFHKTTFIRLRCSSLKELHLCSIQFGSHAELIRLLVAFARLSSLKCADVGFAQASATGLDSLKITARRRLVKLSTLTVQDMASESISLLLEIAQDVLANLHIFHIKGTRLIAIPLPKSASLPILTNLSLITLNWRNKSGVPFTVSLRTFFRSASGLRVTRNQLRWAPNLRSIGIQLHQDAKCSELWWFRDHFIFLRRALPSMQKHYLGLRRGFADLGLKQNLIALYLPSGWSQGVSSMLRRYLEKDSDELSRKGWLAIEINGGTSPDPSPVTVYGHEKPVIALTASPDGNWIATGSGDGYVVLWDARHPMQVAKERRGSADSSQSLSFSPDSHHLAFPADAKGTIQIEHIGARDRPYTLAVLHMSNVETVSHWSFFSQHCAWSPDGRKLSAVAFTTLSSQPVSACVWDATTYTLLHTIKLDSSIDADYPSLPLLHRPLVNCFFDGHWLAVVWFPSAYLEDWDAVLSLMSRSKHMHTTPSFVGDITTGTRCSTMPEVVGLQLSCSVTPIPDQCRVTIVCRADISVWDFLGYPKDRLPRLCRRQTFVLSPNAQRLLSWGKSWFKVWDTRSGRCTAAFCCTNVVGGCFSPDGQCVAVCSEDGFDGLLQVGRMSYGVLLGSFEYTGLPRGSVIPNTRAIAFSKDGKTVYLGTPFGDVLMFPLSLPSPSPNATHDDHTMRWQRYDDED